MAADVKTHLYEWSTTEGSNLPVGSTVVSTNLDDNLRMIQKVVRDLSAPTTLAAGTSTDLGSKDETFITLTGTAATITALGTVSAGIYKWVIFNAAHVLTHNATSLILPTGANITAADKDVACFMSLGSGNWRCVSYTRASGQPLVAAALSGLAAAIAANTTANGDYAQAWQWALTTASKQGFSITESAASTGAGSILFDVSTIAASTAWPMRLRHRTAEVFAIDADGNAFMSSAVGESLYLGYRSTAAVPTTSGIPGAVYIKAQTSTDSSAGGAVILKGGASDGGAGGAVFISGGDTDTSGTGGAVTVSGGTGATTNGAVNLNGNSVVVTATTGLWLYESRIKVFANTPPTITANGGAGAAIAGSDACFQVTFGTGSPTSVTVTFNVAYGIAPYVLVSGTQSGQIVHVAAVNTTTVQISSSTAFNSGTKINVLCIEQGA